MSAVLKHTFWKGDLHMAESFLAGTEFKDSSRKEKNLNEILAGLVGQRWQATLKTDETTALVETDLLVTGVNRREDRIEAGHLTVDAVYFELVNDKLLRLFIPLGQFRRVERFGTSVNVYCDTYWWTFRRTS